MGKSSSKRGMLVFKGEDPKKKKKKSKNVVPNAASSTSAVVVAAAAAEPSKTTTATTATMVTGTGLITSSGTVVTGHGTRFDKELAAGDAILVSVADGEQQQMRVVTMRLSDISLNTSSAFCPSLKIPVAFSMIRKPRDEAKLRRLHDQAVQASQQEQEERASGTFGSTAAFVYRERTETGNYRIRTETIDSATKTRSDLLQKRAKKTSDKYC